MQSNRRMYDTTRWRRLRIWFLIQYPLCAMCVLQGRDTAATTVDHIQPHKNNYDLFWDINNLQSLCYTCHNASKHMQELHGYSQACDVDGLPLDKGHIWNKRKV